MSTDDDSSIQTRPSLLDRLKRTDDVEGWQDFYRVYGRLVRDFALKAGLTATEADEVVQETAIGASRNLPEYRYDPKVCRFKSWLLNQASWRVKDQLKKRRWPSGSQNPMSEDSAPASGAAEGDTSRTSAINRIADKGAEDLDALFEREWRRNLFSSALERVKGKFSLKQFQIFDLLVVQEWPASQVARSFSVSLANVYVIRHRIASAIKKESRKLERELERAAREQSQPKK